SKEGPRVMATNEIDLRAHGITEPGTVHANLPAAALTELALARSEGSLTETGALVAYTGAHTGPSPSDRSIVASPAIQEEIAWGGVNTPLEPAACQHLHARAVAYLRQRDLFVFDGWACADPRHRLSVRVIAEKAWHALFSRCLLLRPTADERADFRPDI